VADCFSTLDGTYRKVLKFRLKGLRYGEIALRMGVNENTVATWVSRGIRELGRRIRRQMDHRHE
jgi:DNA-directed RNA polymerase specialized sigma24 family protein